MVKTVKGKYGVCYICDLFDSEYGLNTLDKNKWDLGLTDPPYNIGKGIIQRAANARKHPIVYYPDKMKATEYQQFSRDWFKVLSEHTRRVVFTPGNKNFRWWINEYDKMDFVTHYNRGRGAEQLNAKLSLHEHILSWKVDKTTGKFKFSIYELHSHVKEKLPLKHPCPKNVNLWRRIFDDLKPSSVIDCFMGSGTTAEICEERGIPWVGFERSNEYINDLELKIQRGIKSHQSYKQDKQKSLSSFFK